MSKRKPKPTHIYREELHDAGLFNHTTQSFVEPYWYSGTSYATAADIRQGSRDSARQHFSEKAEVRYWIGEITWKPVFQSEEAA